MPLTLTRHAWIGLRWTPCPSLDAHGRAVLVRWPDAEVEHVACGTVHRRDGRIVAECRRRNGWPIWEGWIRDPAEEDARAGEMTMTRSDSISKLVPALIAAQRQMGPAIKTAVNPHFKSRYVDLEGAWEACREALWDQGLTVIQTTATGGDAGTRLVTLLAHASGEWIAGEYPLKPVKDDPQGLGAALTYARRYGLMAIVGLAPEDDDGNGAGRARDRRERAWGGGADAGPPAAAARPAADEPPRTGRDLMDWAKDRREDTGKDVLGYLARWAERQGYPQRLVDWDADQVAAGFEAASRKLAAVAPANGTSA